MFNERIQQQILKIHRTVFPFPKDWMHAEEEQAGKLIEDALREPSPCLTARFGSIEMEALMAYVHRNTVMNPLERLYRFASWDIRYRGWSEPLVKKLCNNAGVFPADRPLLDRFAELYLSLAPHIDILGSWIHAELQLQDRMPSCKHIPLAQLEPYLSNSPWSRALAGKNVLVIHPFTESIQAQYDRRDKLFENPDVLPSFNLITLKAVQSAGGNPVPFETWFDALNAMKEKMDQIDFDVALIGAGAYGLPLAAYAKETGKKAVHTGGATQMLFGIYGQRWLNDPVRKKYINEYWVRPLESDWIPAAQSIENGCYW